jgi:hypothetical protein
VRHAPDAPHLRDAGGSADAPHPRDVVAQDGGPDAADARDARAVEGHPDAAHARDASVVDGGPDAPRPGDAARDVQGLSDGSSAGLVVGVLTYDVTWTNNAAEFDIQNLTGPNAGGGFPVSTAVSFSDLELTVKFSDGTTSVMGPSTFTLASDGSWNGSTLGIGGTNPQPTEATLVGTLTPTTLATDGGTILVRSSFGPVTVVPSTPPDLKDGDEALIVATPEP